MSKSVGVCCRRGTAHGENGKDPMELLYTWDMKRHTAEFVSGLGSKCKCAELVLCLVAAHTHGLGHVHLSYYL